MDLYKIAKASMLAVTVSTIVFASTKSSQDDMIEMDVIAANKNVTTEAKNTIIAAANMLLDHYDQLEENLPKTMTEAEVAYNRKTLSRLVAANQVYFKEMAEVSKEDHCKQVRKLRKELFATLGIDRTSGGEYIEKKYEEDRPVRAALMPLRELYISDNDAETSKLIDKHRDILKKASIEISKDKLLLLEMREELFLRCFNKILTLSDEMIQLLFHVGIFQAFNIMPNMYSLSGL